MVDAYEVRRRNGNLDLGGQYLSQPVHCCSLRIGTMIALALIIPFQYSTEEGRAMWCEKKKR